MAEQTAPATAVNGSATPVERRDSLSKMSQSSHTAQEFISSQLQLEADAREALPYQFDSCTQPLGALRQLLFSCLTCNPPPASPSDSYTSAGLCYSCSISCHGDHTLVELFNKRNFVCDCGTTRILSTTPCALRIDTTSGTKGGVTGETPAEGNKYNKNFGNRFCGCGEVYNPHEEKGTMFQCLGLGTVEEGGCGEDWWHPECLVGLKRKWYEDAPKDPADQPVRDAVQTENVPREGVEIVNGSAESNSNENEEDAQGDDPPMPPGFPDEDTFEHIICYKCVDANPWIKRYAGAPGFLPAVFHVPDRTTNGTDAASSESQVPDAASMTKKRKAEDDEQANDQPENKKQRNGAEDIHQATKEPLSPKSEKSCRYEVLPVQSNDQLSLFVKEGFRDHICRCADCFPRLKPFPQLIEEEETYEPPISEDGDGTGAQSVGTGSLLERGEAALSNIDRVRAIEGVMVYNHLKDKVKSFLQPFAESGQAVGAEDIKTYFEKLRGDAEAMKAASAGAHGSSGDDDGDNRKEQSGY